MKFVSLQENLKDALYVVGHIAGKNVNLPILNNVLISAEKNNISLTTTDLELGIICKIRGKIEQEGGYTVDSRILYDYISLLPNKKTEIELSGNEIKINCEKYNTKIKGMNPEEYPVIPENLKENKYSLSASELKNALTQVVFATSSSETRIELTGVLMDFNEESLFLAATDSYRLAEKKIKIKNDNRSEIKIIIPAKTIQELIRVLATIKNNDLEINIYASDNQVVFELENIELVSRLIEGQYPDYKQIIPSNIKTTALVNKQELVRAVKMASLFSKTGINDINFDILNKKLIISSVSGQAGENITEMDVVSSGAENSVVVNYRYLLDCLNVVGAEYIDIGLVDSNTPCVIKPEKDNSYLYIIMPIKQ